MYVGLYSDMGCSFSIRVSFPKEDLWEKVADPNTSNLKTFAVKTMGNMQKQKLKFKTEIENKIKTLQDDKIQFEDFNYFIE